MNTAFRTSTRLIAFEDQRRPPIRVLLPSLRKNDHPAKDASRQPLHARALLCRRLAPDKDVRERGEDVVLRRHECDLLRAVFRERDLRVHESRLDDFLSTIGRRQALQQCTGGEARRAEGGGHEGHEEARVEAAVWVVTGRGGWTLY